MGCRERSGQSPSQQLPGAPRNVWRRPTPARTFSPVLPWARGQEHRPASRRDKRSPRVGEPAPSAPPIRSEAKRQLRAEGKASDRAVLLSRAGPGTRGWFCCLPGASWTHVTGTLVVLVFSKLQSWLPRPLAQAYKLIKGGNVQVGRTLNLPAGTVPIVPVPPLLEGQASSDEPLFWMIWVWCP